MRTVVWHEIPEDEVLRHQWNAMVQQMPCPEIFYTYEWAIAVQRAYSASLRPFLVLGYERDSLLGVAALASDTAEPRHLTFLASTTADYCDFLSLPHMGWEWCQSVFDELHKHDVSSVTLANLPVDSSTASVLSEAAAAHGFHTFMRPAYECARILLGSGQDREFLRRKITGKKMLRRNLNAMNKSSAVAFSRCVTDHLDSALPQFFKAHVKRFLASGRMSNLVRQERRNFLSELARELSPRGWLALSQLLVEGKPVAWNYGFQFGGSWFWYQPTFDTKFDNFSPGFCLLSKLIEAACDTPSVTRVDLGLGAEGYKDRFATETRKTLHVSLRRSKISCVKAKLRYRAADVSKISPVVERKLRSLTGQFTRVRSSVRKRHVSGISRLLVRRVLGRFFGDSAILFYQWPSHSAANALPGALSLHALNPDLIATAAMEYYEDPETLAYLLRAAQRLQKGQADAFALVNSTGVPLHFCWVKKFDGFEMAELKTKLRALESEAVMLFDCWTPLAARGNNYFAIAVADIASRFHSNGQTPWIFAAAENLASLRGILKAGFTYRYTKRRTRFLGFTRIADTPESSNAPVTSSTLANNPGTSIVRP